VELRDLEAYGEPGGVVYLADCVELMRLMPVGSVDVIFADPPYRLSSGGVTVKSGRLAPVDKGSWDRSKGFGKDHGFNVRWLREARRVLKPDGTLWVSGTHHIIFSLGFALQSLGFKVINQIAWQKPDPVPNALHTAFTHAHETLLWASRSRSSRHTFNYELLNAPHPASQMSSVWRIPAVPICEKRLGYHHSHAASLHEIAWPRTPRSRLLRWRPGGGCGLTRAARIAQARARASRRDRVGIARAIA
jgi:site-specific DNA-methyltransferase (adenine-specific)